VLKHNHPVVVQEYLLRHPRIQKMIDRLKALQASSQEVQAAALVSTDGLVIASVLPEGVEEDRVSAMSAAMLGLGERIAHEFTLGAVEQVMVKGEQGYIILMAVGDDAVLTIWVNNLAELGVVLLDMRRTADVLVKLV
jgi:predicted regulator of Ras-like GTPase activity (Roadblock/LC7/MglB family)